MRVRTGTVVAFAVGYYLGARAGRERYEQLRRALDAFPLGQLVEKGQAVAELAIERVRRSAAAPDIVPVRAASNGS
jgi:hypothetical protein